VPFTDKGIAALIFQEAERSITQQQGVLDGLRTRSGTLLAAAAIATSFLGGVALADGNLTPAGWSAIGAFVLTNASILYVLWPHKGWTFRLGADDLLRRYAKSEPPPTLAEVHEDLAKWWEKYYNRNDQKLKRLFYAYQASAVLLMLVVILLLIELVMQGLPTGAYRFTT